MYKILLTLLLTSITYLPSWAEGYAVNLQSTRQVGMGNIGTGLVFGATSMYYNPGGLAMMNQEYSLFAGASLIASQTTFTPTGPATGTFETANPLGVPFYFYGAYKPEGKNYAFGLAVYTPFGNAVNWEPFWPGNTLVEEVELAIVFVQPTASIQLWDKLGVGIGLILAIGDVNFERRLQFPGVLGLAELKGGSFNVGLNTGIRFQPIDEIAIGFNFRSKINATVNDGEARFYGVPDILTGLPPFNASSFSAELPLPAQLNWGIALYPTEKLLIGFDLNWVLWDSFQELVFNFDSEPPSTQTATRDWNDSFTYRFGLQYTATDHLQLRVGCYYDETPTNDEFYGPETPGSNRWGFSAGTSIFLLDHMAIDLALLYVNGNENTTSSPFPVLDPPLGPQPPPLEGTYKSYAWIPSIGISYNLGRVMK